MCSGKGCVVVLITLAAVNCVCLFSIKWKALLAFGLSTCMHLKPWKSVEMGRMVEWSRLLCGWLIDVEGLERSTVLCCREETWNWCRFVLNSGPETLSCVLFPGTFLSCSVPDLIECHGDHLV